MIAAAYAPASAPGFRYTPMLSMATAVTPAWLPRDHGPRCESACPGEGARRPRPFSPWPARPAAPRPRGAESCYARSR